MFHEYDFNTLPPLELIEDLSFGIGIAKNLIPRAICEQIIGRFESTTIDDKRWHIGQDCKLVLPITDHPDFVDLDRELNYYIGLGLGAYATKYSDFWKKATYYDTGYLVGKYLKGKGSYNWHADLHPYKTPYVTRYLGILIYLNTVSDGGTTEYKYHGIEVKPSQGSVVFAPCGWIDYHRANVPMSSDKYIITTYLLDKDGVELLTHPPKNSNIQLSANSITVNTKGIISVNKDEAGEITGVSLEAK